MENHGLIEALQNPKLYNHPISKFEVIETHLSWILLTGEYAYKIKKALNLAFADFSTLEKRHFYCQEELRLNTNFASSLYLAVLPIYGAYTNPNFKAEGPLIEYALLMKQFSQKDLLSHIAKEHKLSSAILCEIAKKLANFHQTTLVYEPSSSYANPNLIQHELLDNFEACENILTSSSIATRTEILGILARLENLKKLTEKDFNRLIPIFNIRKEQGFIRDCHGDCHLGNMVFINKEVTLFDCIEFNPEFRCIDIINDLAFLTMDIQARSHLEKVYELLNPYLSITGDYLGLKLLNFYQCYRAMIRAKVALLTNQSHSLQEFLNYLKLAETYYKQKPAKLIIMQGLSGSGKTWLAQQLAPKLKAMHLRSDIERKRLLFAAKDPYSPENHKIVFDHLLSLTRELLNENFSVIVDATFLRQADRELFQHLAKTLNLPFVILQCQSPNILLQERIVKRLREKTDASEANLAVLEKQLGYAEPLTTEELEHSVLCNTEEELDLPDLLYKLVRNIENNKNS